MERLCHIFLFLLVILLGLCVYGAAAVMVHSVARFGHLFYRDPSLACFFSLDFLLLLLRASNTQFASTMFVRSFATLDDDVGLSLFSSTAILAGLRKRAASLPTFFKALVVVTAYVGVFWPAFRLLLDVPAQFDLTLMLLGGVPYFAGTVGITVVCQCRLAGPVPVIEDASDSPCCALRRGLALVGAGEFCAAAAKFALLHGVFVAVAVLTAFPSQALAAGTAINAVLCTVVVVALLLQPVMYLAAAITAANPTKCASSLPL
jgi:hypothetical protein